MGRFILLREDGQHGTLGSYEPSPSEVDSAASALAQSGHGGWIAELIGEYYGRRKLTLTARHALGAPTASWVAAVAAFLAIRKERTR